VDISRSIYEQRNIYNLREKKLIQKIATSNKKATKQGKKTLHHQKILMTDKFQDITKLLQLMWNYSLKICWWLCAIHLLVKLEKCIVWRQ